MVRPILAQKCPKIFVGDPNQQIYAFRGAVNALNLIEPTSTLYLTLSFRLSPTLGFISTAWINTKMKAKGMQSKIIVGCNKEG